MTTTNDVNAAVNIAADSYNIPYANLRAVVEVESNGVTTAMVNGKPEPLIRWEGHYFDRRLTGAQRDRARKLGLASPIAQAIKNPYEQEDRWNELLIPAIDINEAAAYESCSWGLGQVMGSHWKAFGYTNVEALVIKARSGVDGQIELMLRYCVVNGLIGELKRGDFTAFARAYNGPGYKQNNYDVRMREYAKQFGGMLDIEPVVDMVQLGSKGLVVREIQTLLVRASHPVKIDGDFGPITKDAVVSFQMINGLSTNGIVGPDTWRALDDYRIEPSEQPGKVAPEDAATETSEGRQGAIAVVIGALVAGLANLAPEQAEALTATIGGLIALAGSLWVAYGWKRANATE